MTTGTSIRNFRTRPWGELVAGVVPRAPGQQVAPGRVGAARPDAAPPTDDSVPDEALTARQLRVAQRLARKHGLTPSSGEDAVRQLRAKGLDPFERSAVVEFLPGARAKAATPAADMPEVTGPAPRPAMASEPAAEVVRIPESAANDISRIQQDIARRRRHKARMLTMRLVVFVLLPTLAAGWYFGRIATPMYSTESEFVIQTADGAGGAGLSGLFAGFAPAVLQDSTTVQAFLKSRDAMRRLDRDLGFRAHFSQPNIDRLQRLRPGASGEDVYDLYTRKVRVGMDPSEGVLKMEVLAADPETSQAFSEALIGYAEEQIDAMSRRLREGQMEGALTNFRNAERAVADAQQRVLHLQESLGVLDPQSETGSLMQQITAFEVQLREKQLQLDQIRATDRPNPARVRVLEGDIARLDALVAELRGRMTVGRAGAASLARVSGELKIAESDLQTRQILLQDAAQELEAARIEANRQVRYMALGVRPIAQDAPAYPRVAGNTLLAFAVFAGIYLLVSLTVSVLREQVAA